MRGTATALGVKSMARDYGHEFKVALDTFGCGMSLRLGAEKVRYVDTQWLGVQGVSHMREANDSDNPRNPP